MAAAAALTDSRGPEREDGKEVEGHAGVEDADDVPVGQDVGEGVRRAVEGTLGHADLEDLGGHATRIAVNGRPSVTESMCSMEGRACLPGMRRRRGGP